MLSVFLKRQIDHLPSKINAKLLFYCFYLSLNCISFCSFYFNSKTRDTLNGGNLSLIIILAWVWILSLYLVREDLLRRLTSFFLFKIYSILSSGNFKRSTLDSFNWCIVSGESQNNIIKYEEGRWLEENHYEKLIQV